MSRTVMRRWVLGAGCVGLVATAVPALAQQPSLDPRWQPWLGCWEPVPPVGQSLPVDVPRTCVIPVDGNSAVEFLAVAEGRIVSRERIEASAERREVNTATCAGWEQATWSDEGLRLYRRGEQSCGEAPLRRVTSVTAISPDGDWLEVQSLSVGRGSAVRVRRFVPAPEMAIIPDEVRAALRDPAVPAAAARVAASARPRFADVIEAVSRVDSLAVEAWLAETGQGFELDGARLRQLANAGVTGGVIDMMVALSHPGLFTVNTARGVEIASRDSAKRRGDFLYSSIMSSASSYVPSASSSCARYGNGWDPFGLEYAWETDYRYGSGGAFGSGGGYGLGCGYGRGYGYGWNTSRPTIVLVGSVSGGTATPHGRVVKGRGYSEGRDGASTRVARPSDVSGSTRPESGGGSSAGSGGYNGGSGTNSGGNTTTSSEGRTAKPRP